MVILKKIIEYFKNFIIFSIIDLLLLKEKKRIKKDILIIRIDGIGDFFIWLNTLEYYKKIYWDRKFTLICLEQVKEVAEKVKFFEEIICINKNDFYKNYKYRYKILKKLSKMEFDLILSPTYSREFFCLDWLVHFIKAKEKIGFVGDNVNIKKVLHNFSNKWYTHLISTSNKNLTELERNYEFLESISLTKIGIELNSILNIDKKERIKGKYCIFFLGSSEVKKNWDVENYVEIAKYIPEDYKIVLSGGKSEIELGDKFLKIYKNNHRIINLIGKTNLLETFFLIKYSKFILGNDTACIHMAVVAQTKSICILGGGQYGRFLPYNENLLKNKNFLPRIINYKLDCYNCNWNCKYKLDNWPCISRINVEMVRKKVNELLKEELC